MKILGILTESHNLKTNFQISPCKVRRKYIFYNIFIKCRRYWWEMIFFERFQVLNWKQGFTIQSRHERKSLLREIFWKEHYKCFLIENLRNTVKGLFWISNSIWKDLFSNSPFLYEILLKFVWSRSVFYYINLTYV